MNDTANTLTLIFYLDNQVEIFQSKGLTATVAARLARADNAYLSNSRCIAAVPGNPDTLIARSHACIGEDVFD
jgi:hypothetical protein